MKLIVMGPRGKMGREVTAAAAARPQIQIVGGVGAPGRDYIGSDIGSVAWIGSLGAPVVDDLSEIIDECDAIIDFTNVEESMKVLRLAVARGKALVCGTTGFSEEQRQAFADAGASIPVMLSANTSRLVTVMYQLLAAAAAYGGNDLDVEIVDMHDNTKIDAPSGTALEMGQVIADAKGISLKDNMVCGREGIDPRKKGTIGFHSLRGGDVCSHHTVRFFGSGEVLEIAHHSDSFRCFASGAVDAAEFLVHQKPGCYSMSDMTGIKTLQR